METDFHSLKEYPELMPTKAASNIELNKAGYTATEVACGWAGAIIGVTRPFGQEQQGPKIKIIKRVKCDQPTDRQNGV